MENHNYSLSDLENMMPWEREVYVALLMNHLKEKEQANERGRVSHDNFKKLLIKPLTKVMKI